MNEILRLLVIEGTPFCSQAAQSLLANAKTEDLQALSSVFFELKRKIWFPLHEGGAILVKGSDASFRDLSIAIDALDLEMERRGTNRHHQLATVRNFAVSVGLTQEATSALFASLFGDQSAVTSAFK